MDILYLQVCFRTLKLLLLQGWTSQQTLAPLLARALKDVAECAAEWHAMLSSLCRECDSSQQRISAFQAAVQSLLVWQDGQIPSAEASDLISKSLTLLRNQV